MTSIRQELGRYASYVEVYSGYHLGNPLMGVAAPGTRVRFNRGWKGKDEKYRLDSEVMEGDYKGYVCYCYIDQIEPLSALELLAMEAE